MSSPARALPERGLILGRYRPIRPLGSGASGSVWLCWDEDGGRDVALKVVAREGKAADRAEREALAASRLRHDRCLRAYALAHDDRNVYIAYEYVGGGTMREAIRAGALDDAAAVEAVAQVLEGLAHAHGRRIVHRDVKPANVLLADGDGIDARLLDFGLAQMDEEQTLTAVGDVPGTLAYIAPERLAGQPAAPASDVWSAGVMLWEALAGQHPFWRASVLESARAITSGAPPLRTLRPDLPKALLDAIDRALATEPARRPSAAKLAEALREAGARRRRTRPTRNPPTLPGVARAAGSSALAGAYTAWSASSLPFYPEGWPAALAAAATAATAWRPRWGVAFALAVPILPLGNHALALAIVYAALALVWLVAFAREPRAALLPALGPLLAPVAALALLPLVAAATVRSKVRRAAAVLAAVAAAAVAAGIRGDEMPFTGDAPPARLGIAGAENAADGLGALGGAAAAHPLVVIVALALAAIAAMLPHARRYGLWGAAAVAAAVAVPAAVPSVTAWPLLVAAWATFAVLAAPERR